MLRYARGHISIDTNCIVFGMANERSRITEFFGGGDREGLWETGYSWRRTERGGKPSKR